METLKARADARTAGRKERRHAEEIRKDLDALNERFRAP
jgi:hypothetical protein